MTRKTVSALSVFAVVASAMVPAFAASSTNEFASFADALANAGVISNQSSVDGYRLGDSITRAEMAKIAVNIKGTQVSTCSGNVFADVSDKLGDLCGFIETAASDGIVSTKNQNFRPMDLVTRAEMLKMLLAAQGIEPSTTDVGFTDLPSDMASDLKGYINAAAAKGIIKKGTSFNPNNNASRGEAFKVASNSAGLTTSTEVVTEPTTNTGTTASNETGSTSTGSDFNLGDLFGTGSTNSTGATTSTGTTTTTSTGVTSTGTTTVSTGTTTSTGTATGPVEVSLSPANPASASIPKNGSKVYVLSVDFTAGSADATVNGFTVQRVGLSNRSNINKVWAEQNGVRIVSSRSINSDDQAPLVFTTPLVIKAGTTATVKVYMGMLSSNTTTGDQIGFQVTTVDAGAGTTKGLPLTGNTFTTSNYSLTPINITGTNSTTSVDVGTTAVDLTNNIQIQNNGNGTNSNVDLTLNSISFRNDGTADLSQLANVGVYDANGKISSDVVANGRDLLVRFGSGYTIAKGAIKNVTLRGDIVTAETGRNSFSFEVLRAEDVDAVEASTGFGAAVTFQDGTSETLGGKTINLGRINISKDTTSPSSTTAVPNTKNTLALVAQLNTAEAVRSQNGLRVFLTNSNGSNDTYAIAESNIDRIRVTINDRSVDDITPNSGNRFGTAVTDGTVLTSGNAGGYQTTTTFDIPAGNNLLKVYIDFKNNSSNYTSYTFGIKEASFNEGLEYVSSGRKVNTTLNNGGASDIVGTATSNTLAIGSSTISVTKADSIGNTYTVRNKTIELMQLKVSNTDVDDVTVSSLTLDFARGTLPDNVTLGDNTEMTKIFFNNVSAKDITSGTGVDVTASPLTSVKIADAGRVISLKNFTIPKSGSKTISIVGTVESTDFAGNNDAVKVTASNIVSQFANNTGNPSPTISIASASFTYSGGGKMTGVAQQHNVADALVEGSNNPQTLGMWNVASDIDDIKLDGVSFANLALDTATTTVTSDTNLANNVANGGAVAVDFSASDIAIKHTTGTLGKVVTAQEAGQGYRVDNRSNLFKSLELDISTNGANGSFQKVADLDYNNGIMYRIDSAGQDNNSSYSNSKIVNAAAVVPAKNNNVFLRVQGVLNTPDGNNNLSGRTVKLLMNRLVYESASTGDSITTTYSKATTGDNTLPLDSTIDKLFILRKTLLNFTTPSPVSGALVVGDQDLFRFSATPDAAGNADIKRLVFKVSAKVGGSTLVVDDNGTDANSFNASGVSDGSTNMLSEAGAAHTKTLSNFKLFINGSDATSSNGIKYYVVLNGTTNYVVADFTTRYAMSGKTDFTLRGNASDAQTNDSIQVSIAKIATGPVTDTAANVGTAVAAYNTALTASVVWSDQSSNSHSDTSSDYTNDLYVTSSTDVVPTQSLQRN